MCKHIFEWLTWAIVVFAAGHAVHKKVFTVCFLLYFSLHRSSLHRRRMWRGHCSVPKSFYDAIATKRTFILRGEVYVRLYLLIQVSVFVNT